MILLDTTILVYAVGADHPLRAPCRSLIESIGAGRLAATTTVEVIQEFTHVRARRRGRAEAADLARRYLDLLAPLLVPSDTELRRGLDLFSTNTALGPFDAVLAATALATDHVDTLVSADRGFASIDGIIHVDPADQTAIDRLLA